MTDNSTIELQLLRWNEGPAGRTVTFLLPDEEGPHPFKNLRTGPANGQRLGAAFVLIHDDETTTPVEMPPQAPARPADGGNGNGAGKPKGGRRAQQAGILCGDARFHKFLEEQICHRPINHDDARQAIYGFCSVESRVDLDSDPDAGEQWDRLHGLYLAWKAAP